MRRAVLLLALLLAPAAGAQGGGVSAEPAQGDLSTTFTFDAGALVPPLGDEMIQNGGFDGTIYPWQPSAREIKGRATLSVVEDTLRADVYSPERAGNVFARQNGELTGASSYVFSFRARGEPFKFSILLREEGSDPQRNGAGRPTWDVAFRGEIPRNWTTFEYNWTPKFNDSKTFSLFLRFAVNAGQWGNVSFDDVSLRPRASYAWDLDGDGATDAKTPVAKATFDGPGVRTVRLVARTPLGRTVDTTASVLVENKAPRVAAALVGDAVFGEPIRLVATAQDPDARERVPPAGWRVAVPPNVTANLTYRDGGFVLAGNATQGGTAYAAIDLLGVPNGPMRLRGLVRDAQGGLLTWLVRERNASAAVDTKFNPVAVAGEWTNTTFEWRPQLADATRVTLLVGRSVEADRGFLQEYGAISFTPILGFAWDLDDDGAPDAAGPEATLLPDRSGLRTVRVRATDAWNASGEAELAVDVRPAPLDASVTAPARLDGTTNLTAQALLGRPGPDLLRSSTSRWVVLLPEGNATLEEGADGTLRIQASTPVDATLTLSRRVAVEPGATYLLRARPDDEGGVRGYAYVVRNETGGVRTLAMHEEAQAVAATWAADGGNATVSLLVRLEGGAETNLTIHDAGFRSLSLPAAADVSWTLDGAHVGTGPDVTLPSPPPGLHVLRFHVFAPNHAPLEVAREVVVLDLRTTVLDVDADFVELRWRAPPGVAAYALLRDGHPEPLDDVHVQGDDAAARVPRLASGALQVVAELEDGASVQLERVVLSTHEAPLEATALGPASQGPAAIAWVGGLVAVVLARLVLGARGGRRAD